MRERKKQTAWKRKPYIKGINHSNFKAGYSDAWGRGTLKILNACKEAELPEPEIIEKDGGVQVTIFKATSSIEAKNSGPTGGPMGGPIGGPIDNEGILQAAN